MHNKSKTDYKQEKEEERKRTQEKRKWKQGHQAKTKRNEPPQRKNQHTNIKWS